MVCGKMKILLMFIMKQGEKYLQSANQKMLQLQLEAPT